MTDKIFDELVNEIREEEIPAEQVATATERVWRRLAGSVSLACAEIRPQLTDYAAGRLMESRRLLVDDHLSRCVECRHTLAELKGEKKVVVIPQGRSFRWTGWMHWAAAAAVILMVLYMGRGHLDSWLATSGPSARVVSLSGDLYRLPQENLPVGSTLQKGDVIRTARGGRAVLKLNDDSRIELNERTELAVQTAWSGATIRLNRGDIMVQAAKQGRGHMRVITHDSIVSVKGTIFSVSSGAAGSLVSVLEGSVSVSQSGKEEVLTPGRQSSTSRAMKQVAIEDAISWSQDAEKYHSLLAGFIRIEEQLADIPGPALRTEARLLPYIPAGTQGYFAVPNLEDRLHHALALIEEYSLESDVFQEWWTSNEGQRLMEALEKTQGFASLLGEEVVALIIEDPDDSDRKIPLLMAHVQPGSESALREALDNIFSTSPEAPYEIIRDLLLVSGKKSNLQSIIPLLGSGASSPFALEIENYYQEGVSCLIGIDVNALTTKFQQSLPSQVIGLSNMQYIFSEAGFSDEQDEIETTLSFQGPRSGILSWLALPAAAGSIDYISTEALAVLSASTRNPREAFDELLEIIGQDNEFITRLEEFESITGIWVDEDIASSLGTDFTLAVERVSIPIPEWAMVFEVLSSDILDETIHRLVDAYNEWLPPEKAESILVFTQEIIDGRPWNSLSTEIAPVTLYWTHDRGYLIAAMDRALAERAIAVRDSGLQLIYSTEFQQRLPISAGLHNSGFLWFNSNEVLAEMASIIESPALSELIDSQEPTLVMVNAEMEKIRVASRTHLGFANLLLGSLFAHDPIQQN
ncbi:MAG: FecR domain-containing protein [Deltaproteobacteria bacterium]|nr:FecR domain-containing protein [Deltaproteobacteria bacterium]